MPPGLVHSRVCIVLVNATDAVWNKGNSAEPSVPQAISTELISWKLMKVSTSSCFDDHHFLLPSHMKISLTVLPVAGSTTGSSSIHTFLPKIVALAALGSWPPKLATVL